MFTRRRDFLFALFLVFVCLNMSLSAFQNDKLACKKSVLAAWKPIPKLRYPCGGANTDWDEKMLKSPKRVHAINLLLTQLETFNNAAWWEAPTNDLNVCDFRRRAGTLSPAERESFDTTYALPLFGDKHIRIAVLPDPCYQTQYNGANVFVLYRKGARVFTTEVIDGFFSRAEDAVNVDFGKLGEEEIIEVSTGTGGLHPELTNYYFRIDPKTNRAVPKNLFVGDQGPTNQITSALLMSEPEDFGLPAEAVALKVINNHAFAQSFSIYNEVFEGGKIDDNGRMLNRTVLKWDGKAYK